MIVNPGDVDRDEVRRVVAAQHPEVKFGGEGGDVTQDG